MPYHRVSIEAWVRSDAGSKKALAKSLLIAAQNSGATLIIDGSKSFNTVRDIPDAFARAHFTGNKKLVALGVPGVPGSMPVLEKK